VALARKNRVFAGAAGRYARHFENRHWGGAIAAISTVDDPSDAARYEKLHFISNGYAMRSESPVTAHAPDASRRNMH
jgi:hypothetical protein